MSVDIHYNSYDDGNPPITYDFLVEAVKDTFEIVKYWTNNDNVVTGFSLDPKDKTKKHPSGGVYEFHLQEDGSYWYSLFSREDAGYEIEKAVLEELEVLLRWDEINSF